MTRRWGSAGALAAMLATGGVGAATLEEALVQGEVSADYRLRAERVEQDGIANDATAVTGRLRLGYATAPLAGLQGFVEYEDVQIYGGEAFNSTLNGRTGRPVVADPDGTELNRAWLRYDGLPGTLLKLGRQRIILDNARFVGNVGWRQNEQTFDAAGLSVSPVRDLTLQYSHITNVNTITFGDRDMDSHLVHAGVDGLPGISMSVYGYLLDFDNPAAPTVDSRTLGVRLSGETQTLVYALEYARQDDYADAGPQVDADYYLTEIGASLGAVTLTLSHEVLGGDGTYNFQTPLATKHAFNGWADKFLGDSIGGGDGLRDSYATVKAGLDDFTLAAVYHDFKADHGGRDYGTEWDLLATRPLTEHFKLTLKYARYDADQLFTDTEKVWLMGEFAF